MTPKYDDDAVLAAVGGSTASFLGKGSFGETWRVDDTAVKVITSDGYPTDRLAREVDGLNRVDSDHVIDLLAVRTIEIAGEVRSALVFEYIGGGDLQSRFDKGNWPSVDNALEMLRGLLAGVFDMHETGTIHRDIKPANIGFRDHGWDKVVLLDLGLARSLDESTITMYPGLIGTARYMAPEQLAGKRARKAVDLFAVGVTVREAINQTHPFHAAGKPFMIDQAIRAIDAGPAPLTAMLDPKIVELLDRLVSPVEHERGSARSSLTRLHAATEDGA